MSKKFIVMALFASVLSLFTATAAAAACAHKGCPAQAANKQGCMMQGKACPHQAEMQAAFAALEKDLAVMEKGVPAADQAAFMKEHQANLKKLLDARAACMKECKMMQGGAKTGMKPAASASSVPKA